MRSPNLAYDKKFQATDQINIQTFNISRNRSPLNNYIERDKAATPKPSGIIRKNQSIFEVIDINDDDQDEDDSNDYSIRAANLLLRAATPQSFKSFENN
jgi:hypothetical protein